MELDGDTLRRVRLSQGLTMQKLGKKAGVNPITIGRLERGYRTPRLETVHKLARALGVELGDLLVGK
jgi:XRE family transcriptional regulator, regulator of sulfur utilization